MENKQWFPTLILNTRSIGSSLIEALESDIRSGCLQPGEKLPPQRELADRLGINLSTVARAFRACELKGLIHGVVGRGTFVSSDTRVSLSLVSEQHHSGIIDMGQVLPLSCQDSILAGWVQEMLPKLNVERLIQYPEMGGYRHHREIGAEWLKRFGVLCEAEDVIITAGSQNALASCLLALFTPGDRIAVDALTYPGFKSLAALIGLRLIPIDITPEGMSAEGLRNACKGEEIKGIYLMPEVQNPTTGFMTESRREEIADIIRKHNLILLEDDAYSYTSAIERSPVCALVPEHGIYVGGTSKLLGPGFRISFVKVPSAYRMAVENGLLNTTWMASPINAEIITRLIDGGYGEKAIAMKQGEAALRSKLAAERLGRFDVKVRENGFFAWLSLPDGRIGSEFEKSARAAGVQVFCAEKFAVGSAAVPPAVRISLSGTATLAELDRGLRILETLLDDPEPNPMCFL